MKLQQTIIYNRVSTEKQNPELQKKECEALACKLGLNDFEVLQENCSAFKDTEREIFNSIYEAIGKKQINNFIVWDIDRIYRNRKKLISFFEYCKINKCKIYSIRQEWFEALNKIPEPFNEIMFNLMLSIMGWLCEEESSKKSERTRLAVRKEQGKETLSYKGNKWGRKSLSKEVIEQIKALREEAKSITEICKEVFYWDKNNNKRYVSRAVVHKIIKQK